MMIKIQDAGSYLATRELMQWILYSNIREYLSFASHWVHRCEYEQGLHRLHYDVVYSVWHNGICKHGLQTHCTSRFPLPTNLYILHL